MICKSCSKDKNVKEYYHVNDKPMRRCKECVKAKSIAYNHRTGKSKTYKGTPRRNLEGMQSGHLTVLYTTGTRKDNSNHIRRYWMCKCVCGIEIEIEHSRIVGGTLIKSCGCLQYRSGTDNPLWKGYGEISGDRWDQIKRKRRNRNLPFKITIKDVWKLFLKQNRKCALSGILLSFDKSNRTASLDRIDSSRGYLPNNIQWVHKDINLMKNVLSQEQFITMCQLVAKQFD